MTSKVATVLKKSPSYNWSSHLWPSPHPHGQTVASWGLGNQLAFSTSCSVCQSHNYKLVPFPSNFWQKTPPIQKDGFTLTTVVFAYRQWIHLTTVIKMVVRSRPIPLRTATTYDRNPGPNCSRKSRFILHFTEINRKEIFGLKRLDCAEYRKRSGNQEPNKNATGSEIVFVERS